MFFHSFIAMEYEFTLFFFWFVTVNSSVNAARSSLNGVCQRKFHGKGIKLKSFPQGYVISLCGVVALSSIEAFLCCREAGEKEKGSARGTKVPGSSPTQYLIFSVFFCVVVFYKYIPK